VYWDSVLGYFKSAIFRNPALHSYLLSTGNIISFRCIHKPEKEETKSRDTGRRTYIPTRIDIMSSTVAVGEKRCAPGATDTTDVDNFAGLEHTQKRNKKLRHVDAAAGNLLREERTMMRVVQQIEEIEHKEQVFNVQGFVIGTRIGGHHPANKNVSENTIIENKTTREMVAGEKPEMRKICDDERKKETRNPDTAQEAASRAKDREDLADWNLAHYTPGQHFAATRTTKLIHGINRVLLGLISSYLSIRILITLNSD
jgi:hypothetical protein